MIVVVQTKWLMRRLATAGAIVLCGCASTAPACSAGLAPMNQAELFFGGELTAVQWQNFVDEEITSRFPNGFTIIDTQGQWRNRDGVTLRETGHELLIIASAADAQAKLAAIRDAYKRRFTQESVLLVESPVCAAF